MTDNELLLAISDIMDKKLKSELQPIKDNIRDIELHLEELQPIKDNIRDIELHLEELQPIKDNIRDIELHLENITDANIQLLAENYVPAAKRYEKATEQIESIQTDIDIMKKVLTEHSKKLQNIS